MAGFDRIVGSGADEALVAGTDKWRKGHMERTRMGLNACAHDRYPLGGSRHNAVQGTSPVYAWEYEDFVLRDAWYGGFVFKLYTECKTEDAGTSITPELYNVTDAVVEVAGTAVTATADFQEEITTFVPVVGKVYRLRFTKNNDSARAYGRGYIERFAKA